MGSSHGEKQGLIGRYWRLFLQFAFISMNPAGLRRSSVLLAAKKMPAVHCHGCDRRRIFGPMGLPMLAPGLKPILEVFGSAPPAV
jgi:hypothetical protein